MKWSGAALSGLLLACAGGGDGLKSARLAPDVERRAPGVALDAEPLANEAASPARPGSRSQSGSDLVALTPKRSDRAVQTVLRAYFEALAAESPQQLARVLENNAMIHGTGGTSTSALGAWLRRFARADYRSLQTRNVIEANQLTVFSSRDVERLRDTRPYALSPASSELLAVLELEAPDSALVGRRLEFLLRPTARGWMITALHEVPVR